MPNFIDYYRQGKEDRRAKDEAANTKRFGEIVGQMGTAPDRAPLFQQAAALNPQEAMQAKTFYDQQDAQKKAVITQQDKQSALMSLNKVRVIRTAPAGKKVALWQQMSPESYAEMVADGTPPTDDEIDQYIDMNIGELYAKAGVDMPKPDVVSANTKYTADASERAAKSRLDVEQARIKQGQAFTAEQNALNRPAAGERAQLGRGVAGGKPLPVGALKLVNETQQSIDTAGESLAVIDGAIKTLESGKVKLGMVSNQLNRAKNYVGTSDEGSRAYTDLNQTLEKLRNNYLLLAKGVQTEGDATRAWNSEIGESTQNDNKLAGQQLKKAKTLIERMAQLQNDRIDVIYSNYGGARPGQQPVQGQAPVRVNTPQEAMALPPGTQFMTPDGRIKVRP